MYEQQQAMEYAGGQMEMLGHAAEGRDDRPGLTPEQAQMHLRLHTRRLSSRSMAMQEQQMAMQNQPPPEDPNAGRRSTQRDRSR